LLAGFVLFYYFVHVAYNLPDVVHGITRFTWLQEGTHPLLYSLTDITGAWLFVVLPYLLLHRFYTEGRILFAVALVILAVLLSFFINYWVHKTFLYQQGLRLRNFFAGNLFYFSVYLVYAVVFYLIRLSFYKELQQKELALQSRQSELSFLRSQVNPHFLFNSLNNIYALVYEGSQQALPAIAGLSELLRYMLYDNKEKVPLDKELDYIRKYIELQKLRFDHVIKTDLQVSGPTANIQVPPLLLIPFIENAFKHGDFLEGGQGFTAIVRCTNTTLYFYCHNTKGKGQKDAGGGIGLTNIKRRLQLIYPNKHMLDIQDDKNTFTINVELQYA